MFGNMFKTLFQSKASNHNIKELVSQGALLVDVRTPNEFSGGSVKGAVNIPLDQLPSQLHRFKNKNSVIVFCRSGNRSGQAKSILDKQGIPSVINGGTWQEVRNQLS